MRNDSKKPKTISSLILSNLQCNETFITIQIVISFLLILCSAKIRFIRALKVTFMQKLFCEKLTTIESSYKYCRGHSELPLFIAGMTKMIKRGKFA